MEKDLFEDFTTLRWVKWTKRKPTHNGAVFMRFNGKNAGMGMVFQGELRKLEGLANSEFKNYEDTFYWQEEIIDVKKFSEYRDACVGDGSQINLVKVMKGSILRVAEHLENGTIDSDKARSLLLNLFGVSGSLQPLTIDNVNKILKKVSKETWIAVQGDEHGWKEWYAERCKLNLNSNDR
jgi:hypothetical protein